LGALFVVQPKIFPNGMTTLQPLCASNGSVEFSAYGEIMGRFLSVLFTSSVLVGFILGGVSYGQEVASQSVVSSTAVTPSSITPVTPANTPDITLDPASLLPDLPSLPHSKASLIGGTIQKVDRVRDQLTVQVFGGGKMKVLFDPRTQISQGGAKASAPDLHPGDRVYVDTVLDGSAIFARSIRLVGAAAGGKSQGVVVSYRPDKGELVLRDLLSPDPVKLRLSSRTQIIQDKQPASASRLAPGTLVEVDFATQKDTRYAQQISVLAVPGTSFTFAGQVISLDLHIGLLVLKSETDHKTYEIYLDPSVVAVDDRLRTGADVTTVAKFDGSRYVARTLTVNSR